MSSLSTRIAGVLIDLSGTIHVGSKAVEGAALAIDQLRQANIPFRFCTNTTKESKADLIDRLNHLGIPIHAEEEMFTSLTACAYLIKKRQFKNPFYLLSDSARREVDRLSKVSTPQSESLTPEHEKSEDQHDVVVVGLSPNDFNYETLNKAFRIIHEGAPLIAIHRARYMQTEDGLSMGPGPFVSALENAASIKADVVGKPERSFFESAIRSMGLDPAKDRVCMIGDDIEQDLGGGAIELDLRRYLVQTGKYRMGDERRGENPEGVVFVKGVQEAIKNILS
ncbi:MAG: Haloacid dehalogenase-like hydrolase domain-containing protein 2 [Piptocephalis tieghemiana]|nr:MAG: Haloacid dehalogenase-like hydrolase domain-containing protein 2 [Piptocephalis tieghemiana]